MDRNARQGVKYHDGATLDANDVVLSYAVQWDNNHPLHKGRDASFTYFPASSSEACSTRHRRNRQPLDEGHRREAPCGASRRTTFMTAPCT